MTPCRNCTNGYNTAYIPRTDGSLEWEEPIRMTCQCCGGYCEDCVNCAREFPNSVEEVQEDEYTKKDYSWD